MSVVEQFEVLGGWRLTVLRGVTLTNTVLGSSRRTSP